MGLLERITARRQRKAREAYERERDRQKALDGQDGQDAVRDVATAQAGTQAGLVAGTR